MKRRFLKLFSITLALLICLSFFSVVALAEEDERSFEVDDTFSVLSDGENEYKIVELPYEYYALLTDAYVYYEEVRGCTLVRLSQADLYILILNEGGYYVYASDDVAAELTGFFGGKNSQYFLLNYENEYESNIDTAVCDALLSAKGTESFDVRNLYGVEKYELVGSERLGTFFVDLGVFYKFGDGTVGFLDYSELDNSNFDADGNFSYRSGTVKLRMLSAAQKKEFDDAYENLAEPDRSIVYEQPDYSGIGGILDPDSTLTKVGFWVITVLVGFVAPIVLSVITFLKSGYKQENGKKYLVNVSIVGAVWVLLSVALVIVLLV